MCFVVILCKFDFFVFFEGEGVVKKSKLSGLVCIRNFCTLVSLVNTFLGVKYVFPLLPMGLGLSIIVN